RGEESIGYLSLARRAPHPFSPKEIALVETFANQAVIAIENARLFQELQARNHELEDRTRELGEALEQQTAIGDVLKAIAASPTDQTSALQVIADRAVKVCDAVFSSIGVVEDDVSVIRAQSSLIPSAISARVAGPRRPKGSEWLGGYVLLTGRTVHIKDAQS